ncbi:hypothetical protein COU62_01390 [Candidatus Pacearchaeota archaeon CG10_big_fil_rev_8_21_14_0_10_35_219]|nr:hypothetical protein [Candidatus Pacearchaeota archaeon]OIO43377.1 MAG: hypothetical protein AUJ63_00615 [Candidatus Pacearchaeota archaeon CG1_02_35_32]PIO08021.1 MAG: hypothetical protein COU62_01390 [Candidatus Pacearchaeota archaeon CG10_big_fil_rev_8_21_14_0_10_35_219]PIY81533.1 MAG: hypothetical protein COY79_02230 [Candidatus Pacearchaeota archaeon CG_4_10_14_0_8_um_filter_35_169]PIZ78908.1 MAG: hypothetical protein COY00_04615 [Candidatus Pacearchaeota archaeon CG_4_10_14_0_2_um_filt
MFKITKAHWIGVIFGLVVIGIDLIFFWGESLFLFLFGIGVAVLFMPFLINIIIESSKEKEKNEMFLEFSRNLAESVKTGTPISSSIINMGGKNYGSLTPHVSKLANQISLGIPLRKAFATFGIEVKSDTIRRAVGSIREAEAAGGEIDRILDSVANSINQIEKLKKERRSAIYSLVVQGYIIFLIFVGIMLVMEFKILPLTSGIGNLEGISSFGGIGGTGGATPEQLSKPFLYLLLIQGIFAGFTIGKLSEGNILSGIKHSFVLTLLAFLISTGARLFVTPEPISIILGTVKNLVLGV